MRDALFVSPGAEHRYSRSMVPAKSTQKHVGSFTDKQSGRLRQFSKGDKWRNGSTKELRWLPRGRARLCLINRTSTCRSRRHWRESVLAGTSYLIGTPVLSAGLYLPASYNQQGCTAVLFPGILDFISNPFGSAEVECQPFPIRSFLNEASSFPTHTFSK